MRFTTLVMTGLAFALIAVSGCSAKGACPFSGEKKACCSKKCDKRTKCEGEKCGCANKEGEAKSGCGM